jgi:hypothetical protein
MTTNATIPATRVYFATASFHRAWGEYLFLAEERAGTWRLFTWRDAQWQQMDPFHFNVIYAAKMPRIVVAQESDVDDFIPGATSTEAAWSSQPKAEDFSDWNVLVRGYLDEDSRRAALESMVEHGDVTFSVDDDSEDTEIDDSEKLEMLEQTVTDSEILDMQDMSSLRLQYLIQRQPSERVM